MRKFLFLIMSDRKVDSKKERASICSGQFTICSVNDIDDAISVAKEAKESGIFAIELCDAFKEEGCKKIIDATDGEIPVGYVTHLKDQDELYKKAFKE